MCFSASIPNSTIAAVCAPRSLLSTKRSQFTLMRSSIGVISFHPIPETSADFPKTEVLTAWTAGLHSKRIVFKNSFSPEKYIFAYHIALTSNMD